MSTHSIAAETVIKPTTTDLESIVAAVRGDSPAVTAHVKASVERAHSDDNNCMMGGWTS